MQEFIIWMLNHVVVPSSIVLRGGMLTFRKLLS